MRSKYSPMRPAETRRSLLQVKPPSLLARIITCGSGVYAVPTPGCISTANRLIRTLVCKPPFSLQTIGARRRRRRTTSRVRKTGVGVGGGGDTAGPIANHSTCRGVASTVDQFTCAVPSLFNAVRLATASNVVAVVFGVPKRSTVEVFRYLAPVTVNCVPLSPLQNPT